MRMNIGLHEVPLSIFLLGFGMGAMDGIMLFLRYILIMIVRSPRRSWYFTCLMFSLSGPCQLLFLLCFIASWT